jgi:hypothetical protein
MNNLLRRTLALRADKNFGSSDVLRKILGGGFCAARYFPQSWTHSFNAISCKCYQG